MKKLTLSTQLLIKRNPIEAFFMLAIIICFGTLFPAIYLVPRDNTPGQILGFYLGKVGVFSPVISAIIITRIIQRVGIRVSLTSRLKVLLPMWLIALVICMADMKLTAPPDVPLTGLILLSLPVSFLPAWVISCAFSGTASVRSMLATLVRPKGKIIYYLVALLTFPIIHIAGTIITNLMDGRALFPMVSRGTNLSYTIFVTFFSVLLFSGGLNEESGWRGFAQKRLQARYNPLAAIVILWFLMVVWHIPNDLIQYQNGGYFMIRIVTYLFITVLFSWIYNRTGGSILAIAIFHASMNSMNPLMGVFPITAIGNILLIGFALIVIVVDSMWHKLPKDHPAVFSDN